MYLCIIGKFENGILNGKGERYSLTGSTYIGDFKNMLKDGYGEDETSEHIYKGTFHEDKKQGQGKLLYKIINDEYEGEFTDNNITGTGFYIWANKDTYEGTFINGKMDGRGIYRWPDGGEYEGDYKYNIKEGMGRFKWSNGKIYDGPFKAGKPHGIGKLIINDAMYDVEFRYGKLHQNKEKSSITKTDGSSFEKSGRGNNRLDK